MLLLQCLILVDSGVYRWIKFTGTRGKACQIMQWLLASSIYCVWLFQPTFCFTVDSHESPYLLYTSRVHACKNSPTEFFFGYLISGLILDKTFHVVFSTCWNCTLEDPNWKFSVPAHAFWLSETESCSKNFFHPFPGHRVLFRLLTFFISGNIPLLRFSQTFIIQ